MDTPRYHARKVEALLCIALTLNTQLWIGGCGYAPPLASPGVTYLELSPDHPLAVALARSGFAGAKGVVVDEAAGELSFVYPDTTRRLTIGFAEVDDESTVTRLFAATAVGAVTIELDSDQHVTAITTSDGYNWRGPSAWNDLPADAAALDSYEATNADLLNLARSLDGESLAPTGSGATSGGPDDPGTPLDPIKAGQSAFGPFFAVFGLLASIFVLKATCEGMMKFLFGLMSAATQTLSTHRGFAPPAAYAADEGVLSIAAGDLDGDGDQDLVTANYTARNVAVLLNNGNGTFAAPVLYAMLDIYDLPTYRPKVDDTSAALTTYDMGGAPRTVKLADMDGDGNLDILVGNESVSILVNRGGGLFGPPDAEPGLTGPADSIALTHLNSTDRLDVATSGFGTFDGVLEQIVSVDLNTGGGKFSQAARFAVGGAVESGTEPCGAQLIAAGDFNGDGIGDAAVAGFASGEVLVVLHQADGTAQSSAAYPIEPSPRSLTATDLDGDGDLDLAVITRYNTQSNGSGLSILRNNGNGVFAVEGRPRLWRCASALTTADMNGHGGEDLIVASNTLRWGKNAVCILRNRGDAAFGRERWITVGDQPSFAVAAADFDGDGSVDLAVGNSPNVVILLNNRTR